MNEIDNIKEKIEALNKGIEVLKERFCMHNRAINDLIIKLEEFEGKSSSRVAAGLEKLRIEAIKGLSDRVTKLEKQVSVHSSDNHSSDNKNKNE
jgi:hypothetical protein